MTAPTAAQVAEARAVLKAAREAAPALDVPLALAKVRLTPKVDLVGVLLTDENIGSVRHRLLPEATVLSDGTLRYTRPSGLICEASVGDVLFELPTGPYTIYKDELGLLYEVTPV